MLSAIRWKVDKVCYPANPTLTSWRDPRLLKAIGEYFCESILIPGMVKAWSEAPAAAPHNIFDMVWPSDRQRPAGEGAPPDQQAELPPEPSMRPPAPPSTASMPARAEPRPLSILKSGMIDEMAYTLFTDGSIEAQMPDGTMRFASIEELRKHLEKNKD